MFGPHMKLKVDKETWRKVKEASGSDGEDPDIARDVLETYLKYKDLLEENRELRRVGDKNSKTIQRLKSELNKLSDAHSSLDESVKRMKVRYREIKKECDMLRSTPIVEETVVYKEDRTAIDELRRKRDQMREELWKTRDEITRMLQEKERMEIQIEEQRRTISNWKNRNFAVLVRKGPPGFKDAIDETRIQMIDSKTYYEYRDDPKEFAMRRRIKEAFVVKMIEY